MIVNYATEKRSDEEIITAVCLQSYIRPVLPFFSYTLFDIRVFTQIRMMAGQEVGDAMKSCDILKTENWKTC